MDDVDTIFLVLGIIAAVVLMYFVVRRIRREMRELYRKEEPAVVFEEEEEEVKGNLTMEDLREAARRAKENAAAREPEPEQKPKEVVY